jgi:hypothetical protein
MNNDQYYKALMRDSNWHNANVTTVRTDSVIQEDLVKSQIRQGDIIPSHVVALADSLFERGQKIPITVEADGFDEKGQPTFKPVDGMHRLEALKVNANRHPDEARFCFVDIEVKSFAKNSDRVIYQVQCNSHNTLPAKPNNTADAVMVIDNIATGILKDLAPELQGKNAAKMNRERPKEYRAALIKFVTQTFDWTPLVSARAVDKFLKHLPGKLKNYTSDSIKRDFEVFAKKYKPADIDINIKTNAKGADKVTLPEVNVLKLGSTQHIFPNIVGNAFKSKTEDATKASVVLIWDNSTIGKDFKDIDNKRVEMIQKINKANSSRILKSATKLVDRIFLSPQKLDEGDGHNPLEKGFLEVSKDAKGKFDTSFNKCGWNTTKK